MLSRSLSLVVSSALTSLLLAGCSESGPPLVKLKGKLVDCGQVIRPDTNGSVTLLFTQTPGGERAFAYSGYLDQGGQFEITGSGEKGIPPGQYRVKLMPMAPQPS